MLLKNLKPLYAVSIAVRNNCPWHRSSFTPCYFPFNVRAKLRLGTVEARLKTRGGRLILMKRILKEKHFLGWNNDVDPKEPRLSYPL